MVNLHIERELVLSVEVGVVEFAVDFGISSTDGEADTGKHIIRRHPVDMVLIHFCANDDALFILVALPLACPLLLDVLRPAGSIIVLS